MISAAELTKIVKVMKKFGVASVKLEGAEVTLLPEQPKFEKTQTAQIPLVEFGMPLVRKEDLTGPFPNY